MHWRELVHLLKSILRALLFTDRQECLSYYVLRLIWWCVFQWPTSSVLSLRLRADN